MTLQAVRSIAVLSIVTAHIEFYGLPIYLHAVFRRFASIGVVAFMIISAYYYNPEKYRVSSFIRKKLISVVLPWLLLGTVVYIGSYIKSIGGISISGWLQWLFGYGTYLWYMPVLLLCYLLFYRLHNNNAFCWICVAASFVTTQLAAFGITDAWMDALHITNYLFVPNWMGVFAAGCLLRKHNGLQKILAFRRWTGAYLVIYLACVTIGSVVEPMASGYFSHFGLLLEFAAFPLLLVLGDALRGLALAQRVGRYSYTIYLLHLLLITALRGTLARVWDVVPILSLFYPLLVVALLTLALAIAERLSTKLKLGKVFEVCMGIRKERAL